MVGNSATALCGRYVILCYIDSWLTHSHFISFCVIKSLTAQLTWNWWRYKESLLVVWVVWVSERIRKMPKVVHHLCVCAIPRQWTYAASTGHAATVSASVFWVALGILEFSCFKLASVVWNSQDISGGRAATVKSKISWMLPCEVPACPTWTFGPCGYASCNKFIHETCCDNLWHMSKEHGTTLDILMKYLISTVLIFFWSLRVDLILFLCVRTSIIEACWVCHCPVQVWEREALVANTLATKLSYKGTLELQIESFTKSEYHFLRERLDEIGRIGTAWIWELLKLLDSSCTQLIHLH